MRCPRCGRDNEQGARFCINCGSVMPADADMLPEAPARAEKVTEAKVVKAEKPKVRPGEVLDDLLHGQWVIMWARWIMIVAGLVLVLWTQEQIGQLRISLFALIGLAMMNFFLYTEVFRKKGTVPELVYAASAADLAVITAVVLTGGGFHSQSFLFYFPAILAFSIAFPQGMTLIYTGAVIATYGIIGVSTDFDGLTLVTRLLMLAAIAVCGRVFWGMERQRREEIKPALTR